MKVLFLDIDGVCNNYATMQRFKGFLGIDPKLAVYVKRIITETECEVVLSSTWRLQEEFCAEVRRKVCSFIDVTPNMPGELRGDEVRAWLEAKGQDVTDHAILDDNDDFVWDQPLFRTSMRSGLTEDIALQVIKHLNERK